MARRAGAGAPGFGGFADAFGDIFGDIFGGGGGARPLDVYRGADLRYNLEITLEEAARGTETKIRIPTLEECETCHGTRRQARHAAARPARPAAATARCACSRASSRSSRPARSCHGTGKMIPDPCAHLPRRRPRQAAQDAVGEDPGRRRRGRPHPPLRRRRGRRQRRPAGRPLRASSTSSRTPVFQRDDNDLHCEMPISFTTAALGGEIEIPTLDGYAKIKIPAETQTGKVFRLRGKGIKGVRSSATATSSATSWSRRR